VSYPPTGDHISLYREQLRRATAVAHVPYLEIPELTERAFPGNRGLFSEEIHPNHRGQELIAEQLLGFLSARGLLGGLAITPSTGVGVAGSEARVGRPHDAASRP